MSEAAVAELESQSQVADSTVEAQAEELDDSDEPIADGKTYLEQLAALGYAGYVGLEYKATKPDTFEWLPSAERAATLQPQAETRI